MNRISERQSTNVVLFPTTIDYYQRSLTQMLEREQYSEAANMLRFLLQCQSDVQQYKEEWRALLRWLLDSFPELAHQQDEQIEGIEAFEEDEETEHALLRQRVRAKAFTDNRFIEKLWEMLSPSATAEQQLTALDQVAHMEREAVEERLLHMLQQEPLHPLVQFRALQVAKQIGIEAAIDMRKLGQTVSVSVEATPLEYGQFPAQAQQILEKTKDVLESNEPALVAFVYDIWRDFLAFVYGTTVYTELLEANETDRNVWSAALHHAAREALYGPSSELETVQWYALEERDSRSFHRALQVIRLFETALQPDQS